MSGGLSAAVSGMQAMENEMNIIGDNLANVDSPGYRSQTPVFGEIFDEMQSAATAPANGLGSVNPVLVGDGTTLLANQMDTTQGSITQTGVPTNMAIDGNGWFVVDGGDGGQLYTRDGAFTLDADGYLVGPSGNRLMGYQIPATPAGGTPVTTPVLQDLRVDMNATGAPQETANATLTGNLDAGEVATGTTYADVVTGTVYDQLGNAVQVQLTFSAPTSGSSWTWKVSGATANGVALSGYSGSGSVAFTAAGAYSSGSPATITVPDANGSGTFNVVVDLAALTQYSSASTVSVSSQDGSPAGQPQSISISQDGSVDVQYSNGDSVTAGQVAMASFDDDNGLTGGTGGLFSSSGASGSPNVGVPGTGARGTVVGGSLEQSNVSLDTEFTALIQAQHAYQADVQTIDAESMMLASLGQVQV